MNERYNQFDSARDNTRIAAGTHFWCHACQVARPNQELSPDNRYCLRCYEFLNKEAALAGKNAGQWKPVTTDCILTRQETKPVDSNVVSKILHVDNPSENYEKKALRGRGRPRKTSGDVSRITAWRRRKETQHQEVLL